MIIKWLQNDSPNHPRCFPDASQRAPRCSPDVSSMLPPQCPPLTFRMSPRALARFRLDLNYLMNKSLQKYCKIDSKRVAKWVDKLSIMWIMPSMKGGNYRCRQHVSKNDEKSWNADPEKLDFDIPSRAKTQLQLFHIYWKCQQIGTQMGFKLMHVGCFWDQKVGKSGV